MSARLSDSFSRLACPANPDPGTRLFGQTLTSPQMLAMSPIMPAIILYMWRPAGRRTRDRTLTEDNCVADDCSCTPKNKHFLTKRDPRRCLFDTLENWTFQTRRCLLGKCSFREKKGVLLYQVRMEVVHAVREVVEGQRSAVDARRGHRQYEIAGAQQVKFVIVFNIPQEWLATDQHAPLCTAKKTHLGGLRSILSASTL